MTVEIIASYNLTRKGSLKEAKEYWEKSLKSEGAEIIVEQYDKDIYMANACYKSGFESVFMKNKNETKK